MMINRLMAGILASLALVLAAGPCAAQESELPPVTTEWTPPLILEDEEFVEVLHVSLDSDANGNLVALWICTVQGPQVQPRYQKTYFARSIDGGEIWSEAEELLPAAGEDHLLDREGRGIAAGENGVWMASVITRENSPPYTQRHGVAILNDSGQTWGGFVDLSDKFPISEDDSTHQAHLVVGYSGNSSWIVMFSTFDFVRYIRSTDNGETWGPTVLLQSRPSTTTIDVDPGEISSNPTGDAVMLAYHDYEFPSENLYPPGERILRFSHDNGVTFGAPIVSFAGATDAVGNWVLANAWTVNNNPIPILHSTDNGRTFTEIPSPPDLSDAIDDIMVFIPGEIAYNESGEIVLFGTGYVSGGFPGFRLPVPGLVTRTGDLGQTWAPWERMQGETQDGTDNVPPLGLAANASGFVSIQYGQVAGPEEEAVYSRRLELEPGGQPTAARDWQLYQ